jgi:hypothetical protein
MLEVRVHDDLLSQVGYPESSTVTLSIDGLEILTEFLGC